MGIVGWMAKSAAAKAILAAAVALGISLATPPLWTTWAPRWLPWYLESYVNGVHIFGTPQPWLFPIFPWTAFAFAGMAMGFWLWSDWTAEHETQAMALVGVAGVGIYFVSSWLDARPRHLYAVYDYWHTSPNFFLARVGILLVIVLAGYAWCRWGAGQIGFSPFIELGQTSLLVYWVHIEFVYGRFSILPKRAQTIPMATLGLIVIFVRHGAALYGENTMEGARRRNSGAARLRAANYGDGLGLSSWRWSLLDGGRCADASPAFGES